MHRNWIGPAVALAATVFSAGVLAQATYAGVSVGRSRIDVDCAGTTSCDRTDTAAKLFAGYMFTPNFGAEAAYYDMGEAKLIGQDLTLGDVSAKIRARGFGVFGVASAPLGMFSVFGKLGAVSSKAKVEADSSVFGFGSASERHTNLAWGLGAGYDFTQNIGLRAEFERVRVEFADEKDDVDLVTVGVHYRF